MNKERTVSNNATIFFDKPVLASELNELLKDFRGDVILLQYLHIDETLCLECNVHVMGFVRSFGADCNIKGDFVCHKHIDIFKINVSGLLYCYEKIDSKEIRVGENFLCEQEIDSNGCDIIVAGDLKCYRVEARDIFVLGKIKVGRKISAGEVQVGY